MYGINSIITTGVNAHINVSIMANTFCLRIQLISPAISIKTQSIRNIPTNMTRFLFFSNLFVVFRFFSKIYLTLIWFSDAFCLSPYFDTFAIKEFPQVILSASSSSEGTKTITSQPASTRGFSNFSYTSKFFTIS